LLAAYKGRAPINDAIAQFNDAAAQSGEDELTRDLGRRIVAVAGVLNGHVLAARVTGDPRYAAAKNGKPPRKVGSTLVLLDCLSCDRCVPGCSNYASFSIETPTEEQTYEDVILDV